MTYEQYDFYITAYRHIFADMEHLKPTIEIKQIAYTDVKPFLLNIHYARKMPQVQYAFGLFVDAELVGVVTYGQPATPSISKGIATEDYKHRVLELNRICLLPKYNGGNYASMLVGKSLRMLPKDYYVVSYSDTAWGHIGYIYQATNWLYTGMTRPRTDMANKKGGHARHYVKGEKVRIYRSAKHRYVYMTGDKTKQKKLLRWAVFPYPKGDSQKYDVNNPTPIIDMKGAV